MLGKTKITVAVAVTIGLFLSGCAQNESFSDEIPVGFVNPNLPVAVAPDEEENANQGITPAPASTTEQILQKYSYLDPQKMISRKILNQAILYFDKNKSKITNQKLMTIFDVSQHSSKKRLFVIDMKTGSTKNYWVAHGSGSDSNSDGYATVFSNTENSRMTSVGFYLTGSLYSGKYGTSMKLHGLDKTNSNAYSRAIVMHGADYVSSSFVKEHGRQGASWGCPAVEMSLKTILFPQMQGGSILYVYYNQ